MTEHDVTLSRTIHADADRAWAALTDPELVAQWMMGARVASTWTKGAPITWKGEYKGKAFTDKGEVVEVEPGRRLVHTHFSPMSGADDVPENHHRLAWTLSPSAGATKLTLVQSGATSAQQAEQFKATWSTMLDALRRAAEA